MVVLADQADQADTVEQYNDILEQFALLVTEDLNEKMIHAQFLGVYLFTKILLEDILFSLKREI